MKNIIKILNLNNFSKKEMSDFVIVDWNKINDKIDLLTPFYKKFNLDEYIGSYSLDTFYDIFSDKEFINVKIVKILLKNYNNLLLDDLDRKRMFIDTLESLSKNSMGIEYQIFLLE